jgi:uncharacterized protein (TIGR03067 family)
MRRVLALCPLITLLACTPARVKPDPKTADEPAARHALAVEAIRGDWRGTITIQPRVGAEDQRPATTEAALNILSGSRALLTMSAVKDIKTEVEVDVETTPYSISMQEPDSGANPELGVYTLEDDQLTICFGPDVRPATVEPCDQPGQWFMQLTFTPPPEPAP